MYLAFFLPIQRDNCFSIINARNGDAVHIINTKFASPNSRLPLVSKLRNSLKYGNCISLVKYELIWIILSIKFDKNKIVVQE